VTRRLAEAVVRRPRLVLGIALAAALAAGALLTRLRVDPDLERLFPKDDPTLRLTRHLQGEVPPSRTLFVILRGGDPAALEAAAERAARALRASPHLARVWATRLELAGPRAEWHRRAPLHALPEETLRALEERLAGPGRRRELEAARRRIAEDPLAGRELVLRDPLGVRWIFDEAADRMARRFPFRTRPGSPYFVIEDPPVAFLRAAGLQDSFNTSFSQALLADVEERLDGALRESPVRAELAGGYVSARHHAAAMRRDMQVQIAGSAVLVTAFLTLFSRSLPGPLLMLLPVGLALLGSLALGGAILGPLTPLAMSAAAMLIAQGIDLPVHFLARFRQERAARDRAAAGVEAASSLGRPFMGAVGTTLAAFLILLASRFPGFRQLGVLLSLGLALCLLATMTVFPALFCWIDLGGRAAGGDSSRIGRALARLQGTFPGTLLAALTAAALLAGWGALLVRGIHVDLDLRRSMPPGDPGLAALERLERDLGMSLTPLFALVDASTPLDDLRARVSAVPGAAAADGPHELFPSPEALRQVERFREATRGWIEGALADLASLGFRPAPFRPSLEELERTLAAAPPDLSALERPEFAALRRTVLYETEGRRHWVVTLFPKRALWDPELRAEFDRGARAALGEDVRLYGAFHLPDHYARALSGDLVRITLATAAAVVVLTLLAVGGVRDGLAALLPAVGATGAALGACALSHGALNLMNMVAVPIALGLGVDAGIHYACRRRERADRDPAAALGDVAPGLWGSAATTLLGFGSIAFSDTPGLASLGLLVCAGVAVSLACALFLLPALARRKGRPGGGHGTMAA
jgi:predicted RND superfamily exporter protein